MRRARRPPARYSAPVARRAAVTTVSAAYATLLIWLGAKTDSGPGDLWLALAASGAYGATMGRWWALGAPFAVAAGAIVWGVIVPDPSCVDTACEDFPLWALAIILTGTAFGLAAAVAVGLAVRDVLTRPRP